MSRGLAVVLFLMALTPVQASKTLRLYGHGFSFVVAEPEGWVVDLESAAQIANFVLSRQGVNWREAETVIFARFVQKQRDEDLERFVKQDVDHFEENCPLFEIEDVKLKIDSPLKYSVKSYNCPGARHEIVAVTEVPSHFVVWILSARHKDSVSPDLPAFQELLSAFRWEPLRQANE